MIPPFLHVRQLSVLLGGAPVSLIHYLTHRRSPATGVIIVGTMLLYGTASPLHAQAPIRAASSTPADSDAPITVVTESGKFSMTQQEYAAFTEPLATLPVMSPAYVFGSKIPRPQTDQFGHIRVVEGAAAAAANLPQERPPAPLLAAKPKRPAEPATGTQAVKHAKARAAGHAPSKEAPRSPAPVAEPNGKSRPAQ